jgi:UDP-N-acetylglucosamine:LPS N-acetylglucosamine transferase
VRVLVLSALMGGGHNAAGRAVEESVRRAWPGSRVDWADVLTLAGPGVGPALRKLYVANIQRTPALYRFFYASLWRQRWFANVAKTAVGAWFGLALAPVVDRIRPDVIVSTYPMASAGLAWLRRHRRLEVPAAALVCDIAPHPFWIYPDLDVNLVIHPAAAPLAAAAAPEARVEVCQMPVVDAFHPEDRRALRRDLALREDAYVVLLSCGSYCFGAVYEAARALAGAGEQIQTVVICGNNPRLARHIHALRQPPGRLLPMARVNDMARLTRAVDLVVTNAGGATALEALASGCRLIMYRPIAAHGEANAALFTAAGLAETYRHPEQLTTAVGSLGTAGTARGWPARSEPGPSITDALRDLVNRSTAPPAGPPTVRVRPQGDAPPAPPSHPCPATTASERRPVNENRWPAPSP